MTELQSARATAAAELARIDSEIAAAASAQRTDRIAQVRALMTEHGLTAADLGSTSATPAKPRSVRPARTAKYGDRSGKTWVGIGKRPQWLRHAMAAGATLDQFILPA